MIHSVRRYAYGTYFEVSMPFGIFVSCAALCPDGKVRKMKRIAQTADTFFSVPASVKYKGKTVAGFVTVSEVEDSATIKFVPLKNRKNSNLFED